MAKGAVFANSLAPSGGEGQSEGELPGTDAPLLIPIKNSVKMRPYQTGATLHTHHLGARRLRLVITHIFLPFL
jgi:hypothetical protein